MNKYIFYISIIFASIFSCSPAYVASDYDREVDFNQYKTYNFYTDIDWKELNAFNQQRMIAAIENEMKADGFSKSDNPDLLIDIMVDEKLVKRQTGGVSVGSGSYGGMVSTGVSIGIPLSTNKLNKNYVVEMIDTSNEHLVWQGVYEKDTSAKSDNESFIPKAIAEVFAKFPPKQ